MVKKLLPIFILTFITIVLFWQFFFKGLYPFPGNLLLSWHEPWKSEYFIDGRITLLNKPVIDDAFKHIYPLRILSIDMLKRLEIPLWNPYNGAGMPLLAGINNGNLDPFNIVFLFLPYPLAWSIYIALQPLLASISMYFYCRKILLSQVAALFASITLMLSGFVTVKAVFTIYGLAMAILPLLLYLIESYLQNGITKRTFLIPIFLLIMIVSALPQISLYIILTSGLYFLFRVNQSKNDFNRKLKQIYFMVLLFVLGLGLSSIQLLPTLELFQHASINIAGSTFIINNLLIPVRQLVSVLIPNYFGNKALYNYWGTGDYEQTISAIGLIPCFFAFLGVGKQSKTPNTQLFFIILSILSVALAVDWAGSRLFFSLPIPILSTGGPGRIFLLLTFSIAILAGYGFDKLLKHRTLSKEFVIKIFLFIAIIVGIFTTTFIYFQNNIPCKYGIVATCRIVALRNTILEVIIFTITLVLFFTYFIFKSKSIKNISISSIIFIMIIIGIYNANKFFPYSPKWTFFPDHPIIDVLRKNPQYGRFFGVGQAASTPNISTQLRLYDPQYYHPLYIQRYRDLLEYANNGKYIPELPRGEPHIRSESNPNVELKQRREKLLDLLGVSYLIFSKDDVPINKTEDIIWENNSRYIVGNETALPRAYVVRRFEIIKNKENILKKLYDPEFNAKEAVILEEAPSPILSNNNVDAKDQIYIKKYSENSATIAVNTGSNALLVLSDNYYPGWKAYVDGKETKIYRANYTLRAIELPKGKREVIFRYSPKSFSNGLIASLLSMLTLSILYLTRKRLSKTS